MKRIAVTLSLFIATLILTETSQGQTLNANQKKILLKKFMMGVCVGQILSEKKQTLKFPMAVTTDIASGNNDLIAATQKCHGQVSGS